MGILSWLFPKKNPEPQPSPETPLTDKAPSLADRAKSMTLSTDGVDISDLYPSVADLRQRMERTGLFKPEALDWMATAAAAANVWSSDPIVKAGRQLSPDEAKALGYRGNKKIGQSFVDAVASGPTREAEKELEKIVRVAFASANTFHNLRRMERLKITHVEFLASGHPDSVALGSRFVGMKLTIDEARQLVLDHENEMSVCRLIPIVSFGS